MMNQLPKARMFIDNIHVTDRAATPSKKATRSFKTTFFFS